MGTIIAVALLAMGALFLLVSTVFFPVITGLLLDLQQQMDMAAPPFWDLLQVLGIVRVIFILVGIILVAAGIVFLFLWKRP